MGTILIANPKGGSGKTTIATNLAGLFAANDRRVVLADLDRQRSATGWLERRNADLPPIKAWHSNIERKEIHAYAPQWIVIDSPAGTHGAELAALAGQANLVLVPVAPSAFDMDATREFLSELRKVKPITDGESEIALVGNRADQRTLSAGELAGFFEEMALPVLTTLRDTQLYVHCAREGTSVFDVAPSRAEQDLDQWRPIARWLKKHGKPTQQPAAA